MMSKIFASDFIVTSAAQKTVWYLEYVLKINI